MKIVLDPGLLWFDKSNEHEEFMYLTINEQIQNIAQKKDTLCRRMYN